MSEISLGYNGVKGQSRFTKCYNHLAGIFIFEEDENGKYILTEDVFPKMIEYIPSK